MSTDSMLIPAHELIDQVLRASTADACVVLVRERSSVNTRFAVNTATSNGFVRSREVSVVSFITEGGGTKVATVKRTGSVDVTSLVAEAEFLARSAPVAPDAAPLLGGTADQDFAAAPEFTSHDELRSIVSELATAFPAAERRGITLASYAEHSVETTYLASTTGLRRRFVQRTGDFQLNGRADGGRRSAWSSDARASFADLDVESHVAEVTKRLAWAERAIELPAGHYETILPPIAVADLTIYLYWTLAARDAAQGNTVFSKAGGGSRLGEQLTTLPVSLWSDPGAPGLECPGFVATSSSSGQASVFDNGADLERTNWITDGVLTNLFTTRADADRDGDRFAGPIDNLLLALPDATASTNDLVANTERGLLVTSLWYIREVDPATLLLTGLTRDGVYLVEDGEIVGAVNNFRFNESPVDLLARATEAGASVRTLSREWGEDFNRTQMPPLRIPDFNMSSVSPAN